MDRAVAERLMKALLALDAPLNEAARLTETIADEGEQRAVRRAIGTVVAGIYAELMRPIIRQYPDLDPEKDR